MQKASKLVSRPVLPPIFTGLTAVAVAFGLLKVLTRLEGVGLLILLGLCYVLTLTLAARRERQFQNELQRELERLIRQD